MVFEKQGSTEPGEQEHLASSMKHPWGSDCQEFPLDFASYECSTVESLAL